MQTRSPLISRLLPSMTDVMFLLPIIFLFVKMDGAHTLLGDGDTGWHVRSGEWMLDHHAVMRADWFSFTKSGETWFAWEWLWELTAGWLYRHGGMALVLIASTVVLSLAFALLFRLVLRHAPNLLLACGVTVMAICASTMHWLARPHLVTFLFLVWTYWILERSTESGKRILWLLPALTVLWVNLHGGFFVALLMLACYAAGEFVRAAAAPERSLLFAVREGWQRALPYVLAAAGCLVASLINPFTWHLHRHVVQLLSDSYLLQHTQEFQSMSFQAPQARFFEVMMALGAMAALWHLVRKRFTCVFLLLGWMHLALFSARNIPLYAIVAAPPVAQALEEGLALLLQAPLAGWLKWFPRLLEQFSREIAPMDRLPRWHVVSAAGVVLIAALFYAPHPPKAFQADYDTERYPAGALKVLASPDVRHIFTHDEWGDYLIYKLYPGHKVFVDGRGDFYGSEFIGKYLDVMDVKYGWQETLDKYQVDTILLPTDAALAGALKESSRWRAVYDDTRSIVFRPSAPAASDFSSARLGLGKKPIDGLPPNSGAAGSEFKT